MAASIHVYHESADYLSELIRRANPSIEVVPLKTPVALRSALADIEVLFAPSPPRDGWAGANRLRLIQMLGSGVDQLLPSPDLPAGVEIAGVRGMFAADVAEHALAMMLTHARRLVQLVDAQRAKRFESTPRPTLAGRTLAIVGYGEVGRRLARATLALDMRVCAVSRTGKAADANVQVFETGQLAGAVCDAHYVVIAAPLTPSTVKLFDGALLSRMRPDTFLVNVARAGIVDEEALAEALSAGRLGGAALDVFADEPLPPDSPLWSVPRLVITPHIAGLGERYIERCIEALLENVAALAAGDPRVGLVDRDVGY
jgi:phosphoglycerate dehydrogenase-like enzyme